MTLTRGNLGTQPRSSSERPLLHRAPSNTITATYARARHGPRITIRRPILLCSVHTSYVQNHKLAPVSGDPTSSRKPHGPTMSLHVQWEQQTREMGDSSYASSCITFGRSVDAIRSRRFTASRISCRRHRPLSGNFLTLSVTQFKACKHSAQWHYWTVGLWRGRWR